MIPNEWEALLYGVRKRLAKIEDELGLDRSSLVRARHESVEPIYQQVEELRAELREVEHRISKRLAVLEADRKDCAAWNRGDEPTDTVRTQRKPGAE